MATTPNGGPGAPGKTPKPPRWLRLLVWLFGPERRRRRLRSAPFPAAWLGIIEKNVPLWRRLPPADREEAHGHVQVFLAEKRFEGCGGLELTDEIRVTIAAQACVLLLRRPNDCFPTLKTILVYPKAYVAKEVEPIGGGLVEERRTVRLGESWSHGTVVLSWEDALRGAADPRDGTNVVLHEFAHLLDQEDGSVDGVPILERSPAVEEWRRVFREEFDRLRAAVRCGRRTVLNAYGATAPEEFFAVATECFFEKAESLREKHPALYEELKRYYRQDTAMLG